MDSNVSPLPTAIESERYVLGAIVAFPDRAGEVLNHLCSGDFADEAHRELFAALQKQHADGGQIEPVLACREIKRHPIFRNCDPAVLLLELAASVETTHHVPREAACIIEARRKRQLFELADAMRAASLNGETSSSIVFAARSCLAKLERGTAADRPRPMTLAALREAYPQLRPPVIDGLLRQGETANIISHSKAGKSWLASSLALSECTRTPWLGRFKTSGGRVLIVDNELHPSTLAFRIPTVAAAMSIPDGEYAASIDVMALRGKLRPFTDVAEEIAAASESYSLIVLDAKYRFAAPGTSENDNSAETLFYNQVDDLAERTGAAIVLVHHASKGNQAERRVTDVGSGAGAQSRAADCHIVLREHEEPDCAVFDAAVRSFAPIEALALKWTFPLWKPADGVDPSRLKRPQSEGDRRQAARDKDGTDAVMAVLSKGPATGRQLRSATGFGKSRLDRLIDQLLSAGRIQESMIKFGGITRHEFSVQA